MVWLTQAGHGITDVCVSDGTEPGPEHCLLTTVGIIHDRQNGIKDLEERILAVINSLFTPTAGLAPSRLTLPHPYQAFLYFFVLLDVLASPQIPCCLSF